MRDLDSIFSWPKSDVRGLFEQHVNFSFSLIFICGLYKCPIHLTNIHVCNIFGRIQGSHVLIKMLGQQVEDVMASFGKALERIDDIEKTIDTKLDAKFDEVLARLPQPSAASPAPLQQQQQPPPRRETALRRASHVPLEHGQTSGVAATAIDASVDPAAVEQDDYVGDYEDEVDQNQNYVPPPGRPHANNRNGRPAPPPQVRDHDHIPKLKLNIPPFEGRYVPDIYLTWELETEQRFTCLQYPEERWVAAAVCAFTSFACVWWSEHCRLYPVPATWAALKTAM